MEKQNVKMFDTEEFLTGLIEIILNSPHCVFRGSISFSEADVWTVRSERNAETPSGASSP